MDVETCTCPTGFTGLRCEIALCQPTSCLNGASCTAAVGPFPTCHCTPGFSGTRCTCMEVYESTTMCICMAGFTGLSCEVDIDYCTSSTCANGGTCMEGIGRLVQCSCPKGFTGPTCLSEIEQAPVPCPAEIDSNWMLQYRETMPGIAIKHDCSLIPAPEGFIYEG